MYILVKFPTLALFNEVCWTFSYFWGVIFVIIGGSVFVKTFLLFLQEKMYSPPPYNTRMHCSVVHLLSFHVCTLSLLPFIFVRFRYFHQCPPTSPFRYPPFLSFCFSSAFSSQSYTKLPSTAGRTVDSRGAWLTKTIVILIPRSCTVRRTKGDNMLA